MNYTLFILGIGILLIGSGCSSQTDYLNQMEGRAQGTTWHISYLSEKKISYKPAFDSILKGLDSSLSTYLPVSIISKINQNDSTVIVDDYFIDVFKKSMEVAEKTGGLFDVTVGPLVNAWGFGFANKARVDSNIVDSLMNFVGYQYVQLKGKKLIKAKPQVILDFNAIAQGYSVDVLANFLESKNIQNYLVELGGELRAKGNKKGEPWKVGIDQPNENSTDGRELEAIIELNNLALCTSGNYRKFYVKDGKKYAHILDPRNGFPSSQNILSATVLASDAMTADAYATAFMVMGLDKAKQFLNQHQDLNLEVYFIYEEQGKWNTYASESLMNKILPTH